MNKGTREERMHRERESCGPKAGVMVPWERPLFPEKPETMDGADIPAFGKPAVVFLWRQFHPCSLWLSCNLLSIRTMFGLCFFWTLSESWCVSPFTSWVSPCHLVASFPRPSCLRLWNPPVPTALGVRPVTDRVFSPQTLPSWLSQEEPLLF